ncbi:Aldo/keto reductase [Trichodelitschia bisporula]|uniref:Aldo/keto reductase n=1 Tax=Trichodelitschia bisporula TaxID=703511 RepID=A0A6G1HKD7_9PEZI|nr:Aldo/keto reductase [Trichodelitschia bisporula]
MDTAFPPAPPPASNLAYYRVLAPVAGVRVSPLCLGAMNFGEAWKEILGECSKDTAFEMLDFFYKSGGNFIDTSNNYQNEESETWIGEWMALRGNREQIVLATKFTTGYKRGGVAVNYQGQHSKSLHISVAASLKKLQTDYIDLLYVHWWDFTTGIEEVMQSLNHLVTQGKVLYLGISDTPAWIVSKANQYARDHGLRQFSVYQGRWSAADRDFEREIIPMAREEGMALAPWGALGGGNFKTEEQFKSGEGRKMGGPSERQLAVTKALEAVAKKHNTLITSVALAYVRHKFPYVYPIVGGRKVSHLKGNIEALSLTLTDGEIDEIEGAAPLEMGFPMGFIFGEPYVQYKNDMNVSNVPFVQSTALVETVAWPKPLTPHDKVENKQ